MADNKPEILFSSGNKVNPFFAPLLVIAAIVIIGGLVYQTKNNQTNVKNIVTSVTSRSALPLDPNDPLVQQVGVSYLITGNIADLTPTKGYEGYRLSIINAKGQIFDQTFLLSSKNTTVVRKDPNNTESSYSLDRLKPKDAINISIYIDAKKSFKLEDGYVTKIWVTPSP